MTKRILTTITVLAMSAVLLGQVGVAWARAGSGGSRGSRSYSSPVRPSSPVTPSTPTSPSRSFSQTPQPQPAQRPGFFGGWGGALAGFAVGGLLGSMLFGGFGRGLGGGIGLFDILLVVGGVVLLMSFLRKRRAAEETAGYAPGGASRYSEGPSPYAGSNTGAGGAAVMEMPAASAERGDLEQGLTHIRQMDPAFDPAAFAEWARGLFVTVQRAVAMRDVAPVRDRLAPEMYGVLLTQCEELKAAGQRNQVDRVELTRAEVSEAWQEKGQDYVTVYLEGSMLDYTVAESSGPVVEGSRTEPARVEEFWTFVRAVGPNGKWKLTAIQRS